MLHGVVQTAHSTKGLHLDAELPQCSAQTKKKVLAAARQDAGNPALHAVPATVTVPACLDMLLTALHSAELLNLKRAAQSMSSHWWAMQKITQRHTKAKSKIGYKAYVCTE